MKKIILILIKVDDLCYLTEFNDLCYLTKFLNMLNKLLIKYNTYLFLQ